MIAVTSWRWRPRRLQPGPLAITAIVTLNTSVYLTINANPRGMPRLLPTIWPDDAIGVHAWTIWPY